MTINEIKMFRFKCEGKPRLNCWECSDYESEEEAFIEGWAFIERKVLCPYCSSKELKMENKLKDILKSPYYNVMIWIACIFFIYLGAITNDIFVSIFALYIGLTARINDALLLEP